MKLDIFTTPIAVCARLMAMALFATCSLSAQDHRAPALPVGSEALQVPAGNRVSHHLYAEGFQTYWWDARNGEWLFTGPVALLYADAGRTAEFGYHSSGPVWVSNSGSGVVGQVIARSTIDPDSIPWLLLRTVSTRGPGPFEPTTFVQRVNTNGGLPPARAGEPNEVVWVPYTAEYYFYRAQ
ncbi:MAG: DUF3455 domain-containing protein [Planctomycetota bacterium]